MKLRTLLVPVLVVVVIALLVMVRGVRVEDRESEPLLQMPAVSVDVASVRQGTVVRRLALQGTVTAATSADLAPRLTAPVVERRVEPGDRVSRGQLLLRLDDRRLVAEVKRLESEVAAAGADLRSAEDAWRDQRRVTDRDRILAAAGAISTEALERSETTASRAGSAAAAAASRRDALEQALLAARERLDDANLTAPWDGEIVDVALSSGDLAVAGRPCLRLVRDGAYRVRARLPQDALAELRVGDPVTLRHGGAELAAGIGRVSAGLDPSGLGSVEVDLDDAPFGLPDGASLEVIFRIASADGLTVPLRALLSGQRGTFVFAVDDEGDASVVRVVTVEPLLRGEGAAAVRGNLREGDQVIVAHPSVLMTLADGQTVRADRPPPGEDR